MSISQDPESAAMARSSGGPRRRRAWNAARWLLGAVAIFLLGYRLLVPGHARAEAGSRAQPQPLIVQEIRYRVADAGQVFLVWGIDGWALVPEAQRPAGTVVKDGLMYTPMMPDGDAFVAQLRVPAGTKIDYVFVITQTRDGRAIEVWDTNATTGQKDYHTIAQANGVAEVVATPLSDARSPSAPYRASPVVTQEIRYYIADARDVFLVWGINGWATVAEAQRPAGTVIQDNLMHTPMVQVGDAFVVRLMVPTGSTIDYVFKITGTTTGLPIEVWDTNGASKRDYHTDATQGGVAEVRASAEVQQQVRTATGDAAPVWRWLALLLAGLGVVIAGAVSFAPRLRPAIGEGSPPYMPHLQLFERLSGRLAALPIVLILIVAAALRLHHITQPFIDAFSWRETSVAMMAENFYRKDWNIFYPEVNWSGPGPGYQGREFQTVSYLAALFYLVVGQHDWVGRGVALLFGLWGIFALYRLVRRVWDEEHALAGAAVMAVLPGSVFIERSFLPDPAMVALVVTSFWMFVTYLQTERSRYLLLAGVIGAWGFCTKIPGLIVGLPMAYAALAILGRRLLRTRKLAALGGLAILMLAPVVAYYLWARHLALSYPPYHFAGDGNWLWQDGLQRWLEQGYFLDRLSQHFSGWIWTAPMIAFVAIGLVARPPVYRGPDGAGKACWVFHWWLLAGGIYYVFGAQELTSNPWNFHILNPAAAVLAGHAIVLISALVQRTARWPIAPMAPLICLTAIVLSGQAGLSDWYKPYSEESYHMGRALRELTQPDDLVVTIGHNYGDPVPIYYSQRRGWGFPPADPAYAWDRLPENDSMAIRLFEDVRARGADWLGIVNEHREELWGEHVALARHIERTCEMKVETDDYAICRILRPGEPVSLREGPES